MSTKTAFKRVALVAAAALAIGGFSAVAANAAAGLPTFSLGGGTASSSATVNAVVGTYESVGLAFVSETDDYVTVSSTGVGSLSVPSIAAGSGIATSSITTEGATVFSSSTNNDVPGTANNTALANQTLALSAYSSTAGTQTISVTGAAGTSTATITWGAAPVISTTYSTSGMSKGATAVTQGTTATVVYADTAQTAAASRAATIVVAPFNSNDVAQNSETLTATISGPGTLGIGTSGTPASSAGRALTGAAGSYEISVFGDGTAGTATVTVSDGSVVLATETVTFYGSPAKATATQGLYIVKAGGVSGQAGNDKALTGATVFGAAGTGTAAVTGTAGTGTASLTAKVVDSNGNAVAGATVKVVSSNTAVISGGTCAEETTDAPGTWQCQVSGATGALSGQTATVTFEVYDSSTSAYDITAAPLTFTIGGAVASESLATDATDYSPLAPVKLEVMAKDSSGNAAYDQDGTEVTSLLSSIQVGGTLASPTVLINGVGTVSGLYAPSESGDFTISGTDNLSGNSEAVTPVTATVDAGNSEAAANAATDAANEATDAANAATDAANAAADSADAATQAAQDADTQAQAALAAVTALSQQVTTLLAKVASLSASVAKILKAVSKK